MANVTRALMVILTFLVHVKVSNSTMYYITGCPLLTQFVKKLGHLYCYFNFQIVIVIPKGQIVLHVMIMVYAVVKLM